MTEALRRLIELGIKFAKESPEQLAKVDSFVQENLPAGEASVYRNKVHGESIPEEGVPSASKPKIDSEFAEEDTTPSFQKPNYDPMKNIPEGNIRTEADPRLEPPENIAAKEMSEKDRRSIWRRKNKWGATTGDPFRELFGKSLTDLTKENSNLPYMYRHLVDMHGGDHNKAIGALDDAIRKFQATEKSGRRTDRKPGYSLGHRDSVEDIFQIAVQPQNREVLTDRSADLDWGSIRSEMESVPNLLGETTGQKQDAATYRNVLGRAESGDYDPTAIPQNRMTEGFESGEKISMRGKDGEARMPVNPREKVWSSLKIAGAKPDMALQPSEAMDLGRMGKALAGELLESARTEGLGPAMQKWGDSMTDLNDFLRIKQERGLPMSEAETELRSMFLRLRHYLKVEHEGAAPGEQYEAIVREMERMADNPWKRYYRGDQSQANPYSERRGALPKAWDEWNKSPLDEISEEALSPDPRKTGFLGPRFADDNQHGEALELAARYEQELGLKPRDAKEFEFADQGFQRDPGDVFEGKIASIPREISADPDDPLQAMKQGTGEGQAYDVGGDMPYNMQTLKIILDKLSKAENPQDILRGVNITDSRGGSLIRNPEGEAAVAGRLLQMLDSPEGMDDLIKLFDESGDVALEAEDRALRGSGMGRYANRLIGEARHQDPANIQASKENPRTEAHNTFMESRAKSAAARGDREYSQLTSSEIIPAREHIGSPGAKLGTQMKGQADDTIESIRSELEMQLGAKGGGKTRPQIASRDERAQARMVISLIDKNPDPASLMTALKQAELDKTPSGIRIAKVIETQGERAPGDAYGGMTGPELHGRTAEAAAQKDLGRGRSMQGQQPASRWKNQMSSLEDNISRAIQDADFEAESMAAQGRIHPIVADRASFIKNLRSGHVAQQGQERTMDKAAGRNIEQGARAELEGTAPMRIMGEPEQFEAGAAAINELLPQIKQLVDAGQLTPEGGEALSFAVGKMQERGGDVSRVADLIQENMLRGERSMVDVGQGPIGENMNIVTAGDMGNVAPGDYPGRVMGEQPSIRQIQEEFAEAGEDRVFDQPDMYGPADVGHIGDFLRSLLLPALAGGTSVGAASQAHAQNEEQKREKALYNRAILKQMDEFRP